eukprot:2329294-Prymnesium_polylepis.1
MATACPAAHVRQPQCARRQAHTAHVPRKPVKKSRHAETCEHFGGARKPVKSSSSETCGGKMETPRKPVKSSSSKTCDNFMVKNL